MIGSISKWWDKNGFTIVVVGSIIFIIVCWLFNIRPKKGKSGKLQDYLTFATSTKTKKKRNPKKTEDHCRSIVEDVFQKPFPSKRPDFLRNPETGKNLECDMMNDELKLCIERQGEQHYKHVEFFQTADGFNKQRERDKTKEDLLKKAGYTLITIPYTVHFDVLDQYIPHKLSQNSKYKYYVDLWKARN